MLFPIRLKKKKKKKKKKKRERERERSFSAKVGPPFPFNSTSDHIISYHIFSDPLHIIL